MIFFPFFYLPHRLFVCLLNYPRKPGGSAYSLFYREIEFITQINNFTYISIFLSESIKHLPPLWMVLTPKLRTAASNFSTVQQHPSSDVNSVWHWFCPVLSARKRNHKLSKQRKLIQINKECRHGLKTQKLPNHEHSF